MDSALNTVVLSTLSETAVITNSGVNGLDTGAEANTTWYHIWAIAKVDGTLDSLLSVSATAPTMPAGYTYKLYLGCIMNDSSGNFVPTYQVDNKAVRLNVLIVSDGTQTNYTEVNLAVIIPSTAKKAMGAIYETATGYWGYLASDSSGTGAIWAVSGWNVAANFFSIVILTPQRVWYKTDNAASPLRVWIHGWEY
jgi:hypothetical protein